MLNATGGDYIQAYRGYVSGNPKISDSALDSFHLQGIKNFADKLASLGVAGKASAGSTASSDNSLAQLYSQINTGISNTASKYSGQIIKILNDWNNNTQNNVKPQIDAILGEKEKAVTDYADRIAKNKPPTYDEVARPKNAMQQFLKVTLPSILTLAALISPGKYGYRVALASSLWDAIQKRDLTNYQILLNEWKNQMENMKEEMQMRIAAIDTKLQRVQTDYSLDNQTKQNMISVLQSQENAALTAYKNLEDFAYKMNNLQSLNEYRNALIQLSAERNKISQERANIEAAKAAQGSSSKSSGTVNMTLYARVPKKDSNGKITGYAVKEKNIIPITNNIATILSNATSIASTDFMNMLYNNPDYGGSYKKIEENWYPPNDKDTTNMSYARNLIIQALKEGSKSIGIELPDYTAALIARDTFDDLLAGRIDPQGISGSLMKYYLLREIIPLYQQGFLNGLPAADMNALAKLAGSMSELQNASGLTFGGYSYNSSVPAESTDTSDNDQTPSSTTELY
jgi:hypothetical protein